MGLTETAALVGVVTGTAGLVLGILNHIRDRAKIVVTLQWDMGIANDPNYDPDKTYGVVRATNVGRRPVYISHASLKLPKGYKQTYLLLGQGIFGTRLGEGDPPVSYVLDQEGMRKYKRDWRRVRALVIDSAGAAYYSSKVSEMPSWAK
jgi:hypothetical protein